MIFNLFLLLFLCFGLAACEQKANSDTASDSQTTNQQSTQQNGEGTVTTKPYSFYTDPVEFWKDVVEKGQKFFFKIEDPILNEAFGDEYINNVKGYIDYSAITLRADETLFGDMSDLSTTVLFANHVLSTLKGYYKNDYMSIFLEDAANWCTNKEKSFLNITDKEIYQQLIDQNVNVGTYDEFKKIYIGTKYPLEYSCDVLKDFHGFFDFYKEKIKEFQDWSVVYQLQDSKYCREQANSDYDCLNYLYNLTSNKKTIFFEEEYTMLPNNEEHLQWISYLTYLAKTRNPELINMRESLSRELKVLHAIFGLDAYVFASLNVAEQFVLRLNQVETNEPAVVLQLNEVGLQELEGLNIPENNKVLARNIIRNIQQAHDYKFLNANERERLWKARNTAYKYLILQLKTIVDKLNESIKK